MSESFPRVSIITATYNAEEFVAECIESILQQTYPNIEYLIIDGGSTDNTQAIVQQYGNKIDFFISESDKGIYDAWNKGLKAANGEWIAFVGADDRLFPNAVELYIDHICQHSESELDFVTSKLQLVTKDLKIVNIVGEPWTWETFKKGMTTFHLGCFHAKHLFEAYGNFDSTFKISGDYEFLLRAKNELRTSYIDVITAQMRMGGVSNKLIYKAIEETYRAKVKNGLLSSNQGKLLTLIDKVRVRFNI